MNYYNKTVKDILRWGSMGIIACRIAELLGITPLQALKDFYRSETCAKFHDRRTGFYLYGEHTLAAEYLKEKGLTPITRD